MPRPIDWTREQLEVALTGKRQDIVKLAEEVGVGTSTIYGLRARIKKSSIDDILEKQANRYSYPRHNGGKGADSEVSNLPLQLGRAYRITTALGGRGDQKQYVVTIPKLLGEAFVENWGHFINFTPTEEGILITPAKEVSNLPSWVQPTQN